MEKSKLLSIAVIGLLLINFATIGFLFLNNPRRVMTEMRIHGPNPKEIIINKLRFDSAQQETFEKLIEQHREAIDQIEFQIRGVKNELYSNLSDDSNQNKNTILINQLAELQKQIETIHIDHFREIKKICHKNQLKHFNQLTKELSHFFSGPPKPPGPPR